MDNRIHTINQLKTLFHAKKYSTDMAYDMAAMISKRLIQLRANADAFEFNRAEEHLRELIPYYIQPTAANRLYIITGLECMSLACISLSDYTIEGIIKDLKVDILSSDPFPLQEVEPNFVSTLYIFRGSKIEFEYNCYPADLACLVKCLNSENVIQYTHEQKWVKPKQVQ